MISGLKRMIGRSDTQVDRKGDFATRTCDREHACHLFVELRQQGTDS